MSDHDFDDNLSDLIGSPQKPLPPKAQTYVTTVQKDFSEGCPACGGSGRWKGIRPCFKCNSTGKLTFKTSPEQRQKAQSYQAQRKVRNASENWIAFCHQHPELAGWMDTSKNFDFAISLKAGVLKFGGLTDKQLAAAYRCVEKFNAACARNQARKTNAPVVDVTALTAAFDKAAARGLKTPGLRLDTFAFKRFPDKIQVWDDRVYIGGIVNGKFSAKPRVTDEQIARMQTVCADPAAAAVAFGRRTGNCACCGRELTVKESVDRGIGPICYDKYF